MDAKTKSIVAHLTIIGWVIAFFSNNNDDTKDELTSFYLRQMLGLLLLMVALNILSWVGIPYMIILILNLGIFVLWVLSFIGALAGEKKLIPVVGEFFQTTFKSV